MISISPARTALAVLLVGFAAGDVRAQPSQPATTDGASSPANADGAKDSAALAEARKLFAEGDEHYRAGRYALAAERFIKAFELSGKPALLFNLANTYERAGNYEKAAHYLRMYLDGGEVHDPSAVRARLQRLELAVIENRKKESQAQDAASTPAVQDTTDPQDAPVPTHQPSRVPYYVAGGGVAVGATAAIVFGLRARSERAEIDALCVDQGGGVICPPQADTHLSNERRYALFSDIGIGVAAASVATGLIYYLVARDSGAAREPDRQLSIVPSTSGDGVGVVAVGRF